MDDSNQSTHSLTQVSKYDEDLSARLNVEIQLRESKDASLTSAIEGTNTLVQLNSEAITKESVERINADTAIEGRISDLLNTHINDKAYLVGEIERHHNELSSEIQQVEDDLTAAKHATTIEVETLSDQVNNVHVELGMATDRLQEQIDSHEEALDNTRWDGDWTLDSDYEFNWTIVSEAQEWQLHIGEYTSKLERFVTDQVDGLDSKVQEALDKANQALTDADPDTILDIIDGSISFDTLDKDLQGQFEKFKEDLYKERDERIESIRNEAAVLRDEILVSNKTQHESLLQEAADRANDVSAEQQKRLEMYDQISTETITRLTEEADRLTKVIENQAAETEASLHSKAAELIETIAIESDILKKDYTSKVEAIKGDIATKASEMTADYTAKVNGLRTEVDKNLADVADGLQQSVDQLKTTDGQIITSLNSYKVSNGKDIAAIQNNITVLNGAQESTATDLDALTVSFTGLDSEVKTNAADILTEKSARTSADGALSTRIDTLSASTANEFAATRASVDGVSNAVTDLDSATATKFDTVTASLKATDTKAGSAASAAAAAQKTADSAVTANSAQATDINSLKSRMTKTEGDVTKKANTTALDALTTTVEGQGAELAVHANSLTSLEAEIDVVDAKTDTAINNAAAAQKTADSAVTANTAQAADITTLKARMGTAEGNVAKKADASALSALETKVKDGDSALSTRVDILSAAITGLGESAETAVDVAAFNILKAEVTNTQGVVSGHTTDLTELKGQLTVVQSDVVDQEKTITAHGNSITTTENKVTAIEGTVTSQGSSITNLKSGLATTDSNVTAARNAANAANTLAGGKGKVLYQSTAPAAADRLPQNLWIDTTSGANTPKRWNGSAWASVTDKVATDAAKAAANALKVANTKADAAALNTLDTKVTTIEGNVTSQGTSITKLTNDLATTNTNVAKKADTTALTALDTKVTAVDGKVATNASAITTLKGRATTIEGSVAKKADTSALNNYYTKTAADTAIAGKINSFDAKLVIGGVNLINRHDELKGKMVGQSGEVASYAGSSTINGYITVKADEPIILSKVGEATDNYFRYAFYDDADRVILRQASSNNPISLTAPESATRFRVSYPTTVSVQAERGTKATAIAPSSDDVQSQLEANSTAINLTNTEVGRVNGVVTAQGSSISKLRSDLTGVGTKAGTAIKNAATAQSTANTAVTKANANTTALDKLSANFEVSALAANNLLINSNVEITYKGNGVYPHGGYVLTEAWEVGAKYTLLWCASHKRAAGDTTSSLAVYMGGGLQNAQSFSNVENRIGKVTFTKTAQGLGKGISFYLLNKPAKGVMTTATIYWAVLVKGDVLTTDQWIPSAQDYTADLAKTNAAIDGVKTAYAAADTALGKRIDTTTASITTAKNEIAADIKDVSKSVTDLKSANATKFSSIDASFTDVGKKIADTNAAIVTSQNALSKADAAMADTITKLTSRVGGVEKGKVNTSTLSNYYTKAQADSATAGKVEEFKANLVVGGKNLLRGADKWGSSIKGASGLTITTSADRSEFTVVAAAGNGNWVSGLFTPSYLVDVDPSLNDGDDVVFSVDVAITNGSSLTLPKVYWKAQMLYQTLVPMAGQERKYNEWYRFYHTRKYKKGGNNFHMGFQAVTGTFKFRRPMIEKGNIPSAWVTSDDDLKAAVSSNATAIKNTYTKAQTDSAITTKTNALKAQVDQNLATQNSTIKTWVDRNKVEAAMMETLAAELVPHMAGNTELFEDMEVNVGYEGVITALATEDAALAARQDKFDSQYKTDKAAIDAQFKDTTDIIAAKGYALTQQITDLSATFKDTVTDTLEPKLNELSATIKREYITIADASSAIASANTTLKSEVKNDYTKAIGSAVGNIKLDSITIPDTRNANQLPPWYRTNYKARMVNEFKAVTTIGLTSTQVGQTYCMLTTYVYYSDASGGPIKQVAIGKTDDQTFIRYSSGSGTSEVWGAWVKVNAKLEASISETTKTINGVKALKTVAIDNNGVMSGYGLISELQAGKVTSAFGVNADQFYVGSPSTGKKVFSVVNGTTVINDAIVGNLSANKITTGTMHGDRITAGTLTGDRIVGNTISADKLNVTDLSAVSANLGTIQVDSANIADLAVDTVKIKDNAVTVPVVGSWAGTVWSTESMITLGTLNVAVDSACLLLANAAVKLNWPDGVRWWRVQLVINSSVVFDAHGDNFCDSVALVGALDVSAGTHTVKLRWFGNFGMQAMNRTIWAMAAKK